MPFAKQILLSCFLLLSAITIKAQSVLPRYFINADLAYAAEGIPMIGFERFFMINNQLQSWHIDITYQIHYNDQFGIIFNQGDDISIGVYQGPGVKVGYSYYTKWRNRKWKNYVSPTLGIKYLWYDKLDVNTAQNGSILSPGIWRQQSEQCIALIPQIYIGQKRDAGQFCFDYYFGIQLPVKFRDKTIYSDDNNPSVQFPHPSNKVTGAVDLVFGIKLGYIKKKTEKEEKEDGPDDDEKNNAD